MKRRTVKALVCATLMAMGLSVTACGGSDDAPKEADTKTEETAPAEEEAPTEEEAPAAEEASGDTLEDYMNATPELKKQFEEEMSAAAAEQEGISMSVDVKGNDMAFIYSYDDESLLTDDAEETLETGLEATASIWEMMAGEMDGELGADKGTVSITVRYQKGDGTVLAERSFSAQ